jgi:hypothetical protein
MSSLVRGLCSASHVPGCRHDDSLVLARYLLPVKVRPNGMPGTANTSPVDALQREIAATPDEATSAPLQETAHDYVARRPERESLAAGEITSNAESSRIWQPTCRP